MKDEVIEFVSDHPIPTALTVLGLLFAAWLFLSGYIHDWQSEKHTEQQIEMKEKETELKSEADSLAAEGRVYAEDAKKAESKAKTAAKTATEKEKNAKKLEKKVESSGRRDIRDSDLPSNDDLCARANALGVRCDIGK